MKNASLRLRWLGSLAAAGALCVGCGSEDGGSGAGAGGAAGSAGGGSGGAAASAGSGAQAGSGATAGTAGQSNTGGAAGIAGGGGTAGGTGGVGGGTGGVGGGTGGTGAVGGGTASASCTVPSKLPAGIDLPKRFVDTTMPTQTGKLIQVKSGGNLQQAIDQAQPGDTIEVEAGATFSPIQLKNKGASTKWIVIRSSAMNQLPAEGVRVKPSDAQYMPKINVPGNNKAALTTESGAHHYRIIGFDFGVDPTVPAHYSGILTLGDHQETDPNKVAHHLVFDRVYIHGLKNPPGGAGSRGVKRGVQSNCAYMAVINSYIDEIKWTDDSQGIGGWNGPGPFKIINNYIEGAGENIMFGGATAKNASMEAQDVEICGNHIAKDLSWQTKAGQKDAWISVKNLFELKHGHRILVSGNVFENNWADSQTGRSVVIKAVNNADTEDLVFVYNIVRNSTLGWNLTSSQGCNGCTVEDLYFAHNIVDKLGPDSTHGGQGRALQVLQGSTPGGIKNLVIDHNTWINHYNVTDFSGKPSVTGYVYTNNIVAHGQYGIHLSGGPAGPEVNHLNVAAPGFTFEGNLIAGGTASGWGVSASNAFPANFGAVGFTNLGGGNYSLTASSPYKGKATDGTDPGADYAAVAKATQGVK